MGLYIGCCRIIGFRDPARTLETGPIGKGWGGFLFGLNKNPPPPSLRWAGGGGGEEEGGGGGGVLLRPRTPPPPLLVWGQTQRVQDLQERGFREIVLEHGIWLQEGLSRESPFW